MTGEEPDADLPAWATTTWALLAGLILGALVGAFVLFLHFPSWSDYHQDFAGTSAFVLWAALMCAQTGLWLLVVGSILPALRRQWSARSFFTADVLLSLLMLCVFAGAFSVLSTRVRHWPDYMPGHAWRLLTLTAIGLGAGLVAACGIWLVRERLEAACWPLTSDSGRSAAFRAFRECEADLTRFLSALGAILGLLVLSTAAHRQMVLAYVKYSADHKQDGRITPAHADYGFQLVLLYGLFFTILVAAVYLPTQLMLGRVGDRLRPPQWTDRGAFAQLKAAVPILTPLIGSLVGLLLK